MMASFGQASKNARNCAGLSQEKASELLGISARTLAYYEQGFRAVPDDIAAEMMKIYHDIGLGYIRLREFEIGSSILPELGYRNLSSGALMLRVCIQHIVRLQSKFDEICCDDMVEQHEQKAYNKYMAEVDAFIKTAWSIKFANRKAAHGRQSDERQKKKQPTKL